MHGICSSLLESILSEAICKQILRNDGTKDFEKVVPWDENGNQPFISSPWS